MLSRDLLELHLALSEHARGHQNILFLLGELLSCLFLIHLYHFLTWEPAVRLQSGLRIFQFLLAREQILPLLLLYDQVSELILRELAIGATVNTAQLRGRGLVRSEHLGALNELRAPLDLL